VTLRQRGGESGFLSIPSRRKVTIKLSAVLNGKSRPTLSSAGRLLIFLGILSAPRFRSVLSHWIYHCELGRLYTKKKADQESLPGRPFSLQILQTKLPPHLHRRPRQLRRRPVLRRLQRFIGAASA
jgi:hypothetical protein